MNQIDRLTAFYKGEIRVDRLKGKVAIVTGAGQGLGLSYAKALAREGAKVTIAEFNAETGEQAAEELRAMGAEALFVQCDVSNEEHVKNVVDQTVEAFGTVNILVNNAQATKGTATVLNTTFEAMEVAWKTGTVATLYFMQQCYPHMKESGYGRIINVCSDTGIDGMETFAAYGSAKEAIRGLTRVAAREFGKDGITVNVVSPGAATPASQRWAERDPEGYNKTMEPVPLGRLGDPDVDIAPGVVFLASEEGRFMTGQTVFLNGGHTFGR